MGTKHTPGPWIWGTDYRGLYGAGPENGVLNYERFEGMWLSYGETREANARLIAAAPDLLEALQNLENDDGRIPAHAWALVQSAIAKATGEDTDQDDTENEICCPACNGSGEGMTDGSTCSSCKGSGELSAR